MDTFRYVLSLILVCVLPPFLFYWPIVHGFIGFWRRLGPVVTDCLILAPIVAGAVGIYQLRNILLAVDFGTNWLLVALGLVCLAASIWLAVLLHREITLRFLAGLPELAPDRNPQGLVRSGLYAHVRHPRYLQFLLALLGYSLVGNYLALYVAWLLWIPGIYVTTAFEERELRERFGEEYERYSREVPRFIPRFWSLGDRG
jgi:protein-S-isoprenylcysteine O-methyltransferase Ste14